MLNLFFTVDKNSTQFESVVEQELQSTSLYHKVFPMLPIHFYVHILFVSTFLNCADKHLT